MNMTQIIRFFFHLLSLVCVSAASLVFDTWLLRVSPELSTVFLAACAAAIAHIIASNVGEKETEAK